ncbi:MAG: Fe-S cluster assembly protein SufD [Planctomycetota bacterium]|nr:Fe-S cluster assembly protein SufD [Planctomycetota bacterium]
MIESTKQAGFTGAEFDQFLGSRDEPDWLLRRRREAWDRFEQLPWPSRRDEEWIRTDIRLFKLDRFSLPLGSEFTGEPGNALLSEGVELAGQSVSLNSQSSHRVLSESLESKGVLFGSVSQLVQDHDELVRELLSRCQSHSESDRFAALNDACWSGGHLLYVPRGVAIEEPIHLHSVLSDGGVDLAQTMIVLEDGASATVLAEMNSQGEGEAGLHCGSLEMMLGAGANLRFVNLQNWSDATWHFARHNARLGQDASLQWTSAAMGSRLSKVNQHVMLDGKGANCQVNGVLFTEGKQHLSYHTLQHHTAPGCRSDFLYKSALQDRSRTVWRGMIKVDPAGQQTDGYQRNDNLLLSDQARADSIPGLEIEADDVRCTHGSTTSQVDEELIFYANCRGLARGEAVRLIVSGFFQQIFDRITVPSVRDALAEAIARRVREFE